MNYDAWVLKRRVLLVEHFFASNVRDIPGRKKQRWVGMAEFLFLIRHFDYGGAQRQLISLARSIQQRGGVMKVAVFYPGGPLSGELEKEGIRIVSLQKSSRWDVLGFIWRLALLIKRTKPKLLHSFLGSSNVLAVLMKPWFRDLRIIWGVRTSNMEWGRYGKLDRLLYWVECKLSRFADLIIANSQAGYAHAVSKGFPRNKMVVVPNGIDVQRFRPDPTAGRQLRAHYGIGSDESLIGLVGRLDPMKGHETFLRAASLLVKERRNVRFLCVGAGPRPYKDALNRLSETLGIQKKVIWLDEYDPIEQVYNALDLITSSSSYGEGFPNVIGEAMACGIICVATDVGDSKLVIGDTGLVVPPNDAQALASAWDKIINTDRSVRAIQRHAARERIARHFDLERLMNEFFNVLKLLDCHS